MEAHGTGTTLGDPIEAQALLATYGQERPEERPVVAWLDQVEYRPHAGRRGRRRRDQDGDGDASWCVAVTLHVDEPSRRSIGLAGAVCAVERAAVVGAQWGPRRAGVSSFGISGTNAHVILEEAPAPSASQLRGVQGSSDGARGECLEVKLLLGCRGCCRVVGMVDCVRQAGRLQAFVADASCGLDVAMSGSPLRVGRRSSIVRWFWVGVVGGCWRVWGVLVGVWLSWVLLRVWLVGLVVWRFCLLVRVLSGWVWVVGCMGLLGVQGCV